MQSVMDGYFNNLGWEPWLLVCSALVMLWAGAIAGATALFRSSGRLPGVHSTELMHNDGSLDAGSPRRPREKD